jgi:hypothetical protein
MQFCHWIGLIEIANLRDIVSESQAPNVLVEDYGCGVCQINAIQEMFVWSKLCTVFEALGRFSAFC